MPRYKKVLSQEAANKNDVYGKYLFGQERSLPNKKQPEVNTDSENDLYVALSHQYHGEMEDLTPFIDQMTELEDEGKYLDVLRVPAKYKYAYRVMGCNLDDLKDILGGPPAKVTPGRVTHAPRGTFWAGAGDYGREHYSWTVRPQAFKEMLDDWGFLNQRQDYLVFLRAPIKNGNRFLLNPDSSVLRDLSDEFAYQDEVISVGDVECDGVWYTNATKHRENGWVNPKRSSYALDSRATRQMVGHDKELRSLKETLDYLVSEDAANEASLSRYQRLKMSSPAVWKAAHRRAEFVDACLRKGLSFVASLMPFMKLLAKEAQEGSLSEPSKKNVEDALVARFPEEATRKKAVSFYRRLSGLQRLFRASRLRKKKS